MNKPNKMLMTQISYHFGISKVVTALNFDTTLN